MDYQNLVTSNDDPINTFTAYFWETPVLAEISTITFHEAPYNKKRIVITDYKVN